MEGRKNGPGIQIAVSQIDDQLQACPHVPSPASASAAPPPPAEGPATRTSGAGPGGGG